MSNPHVRRMLTHRATVGPIGQTVVRGRTVQAWDNPSTGVCCHVFHITQGESQRAFGVEPEGMLGGRFLSEEASIVQGGFVEMETGGKTPRWLQGMRFEVRKISGVEDAGIDSQLALLDRTTRTLST